MGLFIRKFSSASAFLLFIFFCGSTYSQLNVNTAVTPAQVVNTLIGPGITVSNINLNCPSLAYGLFTGGNGTNIGLDQGVILTSGLATNAIGPNVNGGITGVSGGPGNDPDLDLLTGNPTFDGCILEFDMVATCDTIEIAYAFGSDEYLEWVNSPFNDVFGFFISGPGIVGNQNIAVVPGGATPVTINSINNVANASYYVDNPGGATIEYDGFTIPMLAKSAVMPCSTYHLKLAIADASDPALDSGVFLEQGGIQCSTPQLTVTATTINGNPIAVEGCMDAQFDFVRNGGLADSLTIHFTIGGNAVNGVDYNTIVDSITFPMGQDTATINLTAFWDGIPEGVDFLYIIVADSSCLGAFADTATLVISDPPTAFFNASSGCGFLPINFTDLSTFPAGVVDSWSWDFGDGNTSNIQNPTHIYGVPGTYNVTLIVGVFGACYDTLTVPVLVYESPVADFSWIGSCEDLPIAFTDLTTPPPGGVVNGWDWDADNGQTSNVQNPSFTYAIAGNYNVTLIATDNHGCMDTVTLAVPINSAPVVNFNATTECAGAQTMFNDLSNVMGGVIATWAWTFGDGGNSSLQDPVHLYSGQGSYTVTLTVTSGDGCISSMTQTVIVNPNPVAAFTWTGHCQGVPVQFTDQSTIIPGSNISAWNWNGGNGQISNVQHPSFTYVTPGNFNVTLIVTSNGGCRDTITQVVTITGMPVVNFTATNECEGTTTTFNDLTTVPGSGPGAWLWNFGDGATSTNQNPVHLYAGDGSYTVTLTVTATDGCVSSSTQTVIVRPKPIAAFSSNTPCRYDLSVFTDLSTIDGGGTIANWNWNFADGGTSTLANPTHLYLVDGSYLVSLIVTSDLGCSDTVQNPAVVTPAPAIPVTFPDSVCVGSDLTLNVAVTAGNVVNWFYSPTSSTPFYTGLSYTTPPTAQSFTYWVQAVTPAGCRSAMYPITGTILVPPNPIWTVSTRETEIPNAVVEFNILNYSLYSSLLWQFSDGSSSTAANGVHQFIAPGYFDITITAVDKYGCEIVNHFEDYINVTETIRLYVPNAFTPNGDGVNDEFFIVTRLITELHISIFDRWGKMIYESKDMNFHWNGKAFEADLPEGAYVYTIDAREFNGNMIHKSGSITLIR